MDLSSLTLEQLKEIVKLYQKEISKREPVNPVSVLTEWSKSHYRRHNFEVIIRNTEYYIVLTVVDEKRKIFTFSGSTTYIYGAGGLVKSKNNQNKQKLKAELAS